ncbi:gliding motility-associated C-terminal domain-containing protein [Aurantibacter crassamenti]|uniref:T9SS type B sorting domain-containing protein n=1 Tax=Aurantibacter crassamenti TaxID=1837375 RepID=UPI001939E9AA|nr:gliding motility-associated C-terminal domain-containing protein [Aurantibacter crassamenti]MBM1107699.1 gliding motility-associated C-terminal domain-containing protein [Aurantibacter crassamenti]
MTLEFLKNLLSRTNVSTRKANAFVTFIISFIAVVSVSGQINNASYRVDLSSTDMRPCGGANNGLSTVGIRGKKASLNTFKIAFDLPDGIFYETGSFVINSQIGSGDLVLSEFDISNLNAPIFQIERPSNSNWQIDDFIEFTFEKTAACEAVQYSYDGGLFKDTHSITYTDGSNSRTNTDNDNTVNSYSLLKAYLAVEDIDIQEAFVGQTYNRDIIITNSGNGSIQAFAHEVNVPSNLQANYQLSFNGTTLTPNISGDIYTYEIDLNNAPFLGNVGDSDNAFENETITLVEQIVLLDCSSNTVITHSPRWGCTAGTLCQIGAPIPGFINFDQEWGDISLTTIADPNARWDAPVTYTYAIDNDNNAENAYDVNINIGFTWNGSYSRPGFNPLRGDEDTNRILSNFNFTGGSSVTPQRWPSTTGGSGPGSFHLPHDFFASDPDGPGGLDDLDGDGFYDDLLPGESTEINFDMVMDPETPSCSPYSADYVSSESLNIDIWNENTCGNYNRRDREEVDRHYVRRESLFNWGAPENYDLDAEDGSTFNLSFTGNFVASSGSPMCGSTEMFSNDASTRYLAVIDVPTGITLDSSADPRYTQVGNQIIFTETNLADFVYNSYLLQIPINFPLNIDCSTYTGPVEVELDYTTSYESSCYSTDLHCGQFDITTHCPNSCVGPTTTSFDANRITAGWTDETMATKVTLDPNVHATKFYMPKDEMVVTTSAFMQNDSKDNLHFEMRYVTDNGESMADIISFTTGTITINDLSTGSPQTFPITNAPVVTTQGTNDNFFTLDLSSYQSLISPTYAYGEGLEADEITLELHFQFKDDFPQTAHLYEFYSFHGRFFSLDTSSNEISCDTYNDRAYFFQDEVKMFFNNNDSVTGCDNKWLSVGIEQASGVSDKFPNEFRPPVIWESTSIEIPAGMVFNGEVTSSGYPYLQPEGEPASNANNGLNFTVSGNIVTITPGPRFLQLDQQGNNYPSIRISVTATSETPNMSVHDVSTTYQKYAYSDDPILITENDTKDFEYEIPNYYLSSDSSTEIGNEQVESFTVDICTDNDDEINNNWLRVDTGTGYTITNAYLVEGGTESLLNFTTSGNLTFIEFGTMESSSWVCKKIRFEGTYTEDSTQEIRVSHNYDCVAYPTNYDSTVFFNEISLTLEPVAAAIQLLILQQPTSSVTTCSDFDIELEARNAGEADLIAPIINFDIPGDISSLTINDITIEYPQNSGNIEFITPIISGNNVAINLLEHTGIAANNGLLGSLNAPMVADQIAIINLNLSPQCNYQSNTGTAYTIIGNNPSGTDAIGSGSRISANPIIITGAEPPYSTNTIVLDSPTFTGCVIETISIETNIEDGLTGSNDFSRIVLPSGLIYVDGSLTSTGTQAVTFVSKDTVGDHEEITIALPAGADSSDIIAYNIGVQGIGDICEGTYDIDLSTFVTVSGLSCSGVSCGTTEVNTGNASTTAVVTKGNLTASTYVATAEYAQVGSNTNYALTIGLENTGTENLDSGITYNVFCADGAGVITGSSLYTGTLSQSIPTGNTIEETISFASSTFCGDNSNLVVEFTPSNTDCFCNPLSIVISSMSSTDLTDLSIDKRLATGSSNTPNVGDTITFEIEISSDGTATNVSLEDIIPVGYTVDTASISDGGILTGNIINWTIASINTTSVIVSYTVTINEPTGASNEYTNIAQITASDQLDPDSTPNNDDGDQSEDDEDSVTDVMVDSVDLGITKNVSPSSAAIGDTVIFTIMAINLGSSEITNIEIVDELPAGYDYVLGTTDNGTYDNQTSLWVINSLPAQESAELTIEAIVIEGEQYTNIAELITMDQLDQNENNDRDEATIDLVTDDCLKVYNEFSPNGDLSNEHFHIDCIEDYPNNHLEVYNRWGTKVFETIGYQNDWNGTSQGRSTFNKEDQLPVGTYYYILDLGDNQTQPTSGWLYITR